MTLTITVDSDLLEQVTPILARYGLTPEQAIELFFHWCAKEPEAAIEFLKEGLAYERRQI